MRATYLAFITILLTASSCINLDRQEIEYYSKLTGIISPYLDYNPRGQVDLDTLMPPSYYRVKYNRRGQISDLSYYKSGKPSNNSYYGTHRVVYEYSRGRLIRKYFDTEGNKSDMSRHYYGGGAIHMEEFELSDSGIKQRLFLRDTNGIRLTSGLGHYEFRWSLATDSSVVQEQFDQEGNPIYLTSYFPFRKSVISKDKRGYLATISNLDNQSNRFAMQNEAGYAHVVFDFDNYGNERGWSFYDIQGELSNRQAVANMEYGYAQCRYEFKYRNQPLGLSEYFSMNFYDNQDRPVENELGIHRTVFELDHNDNLVAMTYFDQNREPCEHPTLGFHRVEINYDELGNELSTVKYTADGQVQ
ncbi:hypothetical protein BFP97_04685 [Roseivirga sp. 4D4]|uniref:hypothetical protein n=1 Tax=Roseivirga sp. 4D4 TaxID=1889784 RepID=UPI000853CE35|nr:hypothetical protein [Roseivirga sp. 4D4]OEK00847.1 hypothetical protein BFP97_04685 [Roseivirga sp. 4D4]